MRKHLILTPAIALLVSAALLTGCGSAAGSASNGNGAYYANDEAVIEAEYASEDAAFGAASDSYAFKDEQAPTAEERKEDPAAEQAENAEKIVYTGYIRVETMDYAASLKDLRAKITEAGGFVESESESNNGGYWQSSGYAAGTKNLYITVRIPSKRFYPFLDSMEGTGEVTSKNIGAQNITQRYNDTAATKKAYEIEQERLLGMMEKAETIEDMIAVESRLSEVERELNIYKTDISYMDRAVAYSTVDIELREVKRYSQQVEKVTYGQRLKEAFEDAIHNFVTFAQDLSLFIVRNFPFLILLGVIVTLFIRWHRYRKAKKPTEHRTAKKVPFWKRKKKDEGEKGSKAENTEDSNII